MNQRRVCIFTTEGPVVERLLLLLLLCSLMGCGGRPDLSARATEEPQKARTVATTTVPLQAGWNPVAFDCARLTALTHSPAVVGLAAYEGTGYRTAPLTLAEVNAGQGGRRGLWVYAESPSFLTYAGEDDDQPIALAAGWNLVSLATPASVPGSSLAVTVSGSPVPLASVLLTQFSQLDSSGQTVQVPIPAGTLQPGRPCWIFAREAAELSRAGGFGPPAVLTVGPAEFSLNRLATRQLRALAHLGDGKTRDVTAEAGWSSALPSAAPVSSTGLVTALLPGSVQLTASYQGLNARSTVTVVDPPSSPSPSPAASASPAASPSPGPSPSSPSGPKAVHVTLESSENPSTNPQLPVFTARVTSDGNPVTEGNVSIQVGIVTYGMADLPLDKDGMASVTLPIVLPVGTYKVVASYSGSPAPSSRFAPGSSQPTNQVINLPVIVLTDGVPAVALCTSSGTQFGRAYVNAVFSPGSLGRDSQGFLYCGASRRVVNLVPDGGALGGFDEIGDCAAVYTGAGGANSLVYVAFSQTHSVQRYLLPNGPLQNFLTLPGELPGPTSIAVDGSGFFYAAGNNTVVCRQPDGTPRAGWGVDGKGTSMVIPDVEWMTVDAAGRCYIAVVDQVFTLDTKGTNFAKFASVGAEVRALTLGPGGDLFVCCVDNTVRQVSADGSRVSVWLSIERAVGISFP